MGYVYIVNIDVTISFEIWNTDIEGGIVTELGNRTG